MSWWLTHAGVDHLVLDADRRPRVADRRWDSFCLVTPNWQCACRASATTARACGSAAYEEAWARPCVFGRNRVSTYLLIGIGEDIDELVRARAG